MLWRSRLTSLYPSVYRATQYYEEQERLWLDRSHSIVCMPAFKHVSCLIISPAANMKLLSMRDLHGLQSFMCELERRSDVGTSSTDQLLKSALRLPVMKLQDLTEVVVESSFLWSCVGSHNLNMVPYSNTLLIKDNKKKIRKANAIVYFVDYQRCMDMKNVSTTLKMIGRSLLTNQTLVVVVAVKVRGSRARAMEQLCDFYRRLDDSENSPLSAIFTNWRLWGLYEDASGCTNWADIIEWACLDTIWKRHKFLGNDERYHNVGDCSSKSPPW
ncbi:unnamed protein product [Hydatigera taeniaeformis]|uniref:CRAL-TRIO domain-containing protein n=1 Tax=Hydatigena taeniaeformis TaxID=6205 RepID=A0A0R3X7J8_HYDTA|nr:unnamed protein product [Hydatigera taeniaeformis]